MEGGGKFVKGIRGGPGNYIPADVLCRWHTDTSAVRDIR